MHDMTEKMFERTAFGKAAMEKIGPVCENFRLYHAMWLGGAKGHRSTMKVIGAEFRHARRGANKGLLAVMVPNTTKTVYVTRGEIEAADA